MNWKKKAWDWKKEKVQFPLSLSRTHKRDILHYHFSFESNHRVRVSGGKRNEMKRQKKDSKEKFSIIIFCSSPTQRDVINSAAVPLKGKLFIFHSIRLLENVVKSLFVIGDALVSLCIPAELWCSTLELESIHFGKCKELDTIANT